MSLLSLSAPEPSSRLFGVAVLLSFLFHLIFFLGISPSFKPAEIRELEVTVINVPENPSRSEKRPVKALPKPQDKQQPEPAPKLPEKQFVSPSEQESAKAPDSRLLSDKNSQTDKEQIKRGLPDAGKKPAKETPQKESSRKEQKLEPASEAAREPSSPARARVPDRPSLKLSDSALERALSKAPLAASEESEPDAAKLMQNEKLRAAADAKRAEKLSDYEPFASTSLSQLFTGEKGSPDFLPAIPDGDITMLNAKADRFAVFVRRVAYQVFGALRKLPWEEIPELRSQALRDFVTVRAIMSKKGELIRVELESSSGAKAFDDTLLKAARLGAWDQNPPASAAAPDGNIHFIFKSRAWVRRMGEMRDQRWLLLATGLE